MTWYKTLFNETRRFLNTEQKYAWMLVFIIFVYALTAATGKAPEKKGQVFIEMEERLKEQALEGPELFKRALEQNKPLVYIMAFASLGAIGVFFIGFILFLVFVVMWLRGREPIPGPILQQEESSWDIFDVARLFITFLFLSQVFIISQEIFQSVFRIGNIDKQLKQVVNTSMIDFFWLGLVLYFVLVKYKKKLSSVGLTCKNWFKGVLIGVVGYISIVPAVLLVLVIVLLLAAIFKYKPMPEPVFELFYEQGKPQLLFYFGCFVTIAGPIIEEIFFRGFAYPALKRVIGKNWAIFSSAVIFALLHANLLAFLPILLIGAFLAYLYEKTGSLVPAITVHVLHNGAIMFIVFLTRQVMQIK